MSGIARLVDVGELLSDDELHSSIDRHCIPKEMILSGEIGKWTIPWKLAEVRELAEPIPYRHPNGAITLFSFDPEVNAAIRNQIEGGAPATRPDTGSPASVRQSIIQQVHREDSIMPTHSAKASGRFLGEKVLSEGNLKNNHFYLRSFLDKFPKDLIDGSKRTLQVLATVEVDGMPPETTDICPRHKFFRDRSWTRKFFETTDAEPGDRVEVYELGPLHYRVCLEKGAGF